MCVDTKFDLKKIRYIYKKFYNNKKYIPWERLTNYF